MNLHSSPDYLLALKALKASYPEPEGFTDFPGSSLTDTVLLKQNNTTLALLVILCDKLHTVEKQLQVLESTILQLKTYQSTVKPFDFNIDKLTEQFSKLPVDKKPATTNKNIFVVPTLLNIPVRQFLKKT